VEEVIEEAGLSPDQVLAGIERFARERTIRLGRQQAALAEARRDVEPELVAT
jgi:hypothetical protein